VKKYCRVGATDDNMVHADCMLYTIGYKYALRICNPYCFSTATMVERWRLDVTSQYIAYLVDTWDGLCICHGGTADGTCLNVER
jgi:hypothetical protein